MGSIIDKGKFIEGISNSGTSAHRGQTNSMIITCQESNDQQIVCDPKRSSINIHNSFQILDEEQEEQNQSSKIETQHKQSQILEINSEGTKKDTNTSTHVNQDSKEGDQKIQNTDNSKEDDATAHQLGKTFSLPPDLELHDVVIQ